MEINKNVFIRHFLKVYINVWTHTSTPQYVFMIQCLIKRRDNFTFTLSLASVSHRQFKKCVRKSWRVKQKGTKMFAIIF